MPDIDPAALSRPAGGLSTPVLKSITVTQPIPQKVTKTSQIIPARIDLEPLYTALKTSVAIEQWNIYKDATSRFMLGRLNQVEYGDLIDPILFSPTGDKIHLHNQLLAGIYGNLTREMPDQGPAPWVSANDKPQANVGAKPVSGDAAERKLKAEVMLLPSRDRRRIKDLALNDYDPAEAMANMFFEHHKAKTQRAADAPQSASGLNKMNIDLEIRKRFAQPLAIESGEFPDTASIEAKMLPTCYEAGLVQGHATEAAQYVSTAAEMFIKEFLGTVFRRTRSNGPGDSGSAGFGGSIPWIQTHSYRRQLRREEAALSRGEIVRDKSGLLPIEAKAASERRPLDLADLRLAIDIGDCGLGTFPAVTKSLIYNYREGELEHWDDYTYLHGQKPTVPDVFDFDAFDAPVDAMELDDENGAWDGAENMDVDALDDILDSCLAA